jgi:nucleoside-diphosphate-sugar epimerase|tara:strand:+ start:179 stop:982 length:804 start_codon:yes stop_codon:yes gene_type:complete
MTNDSLIDVLLLGGKGQIGSGLRTYLPRLNSHYKITTADRKGSRDKAKDPNAQKNFIDLDIYSDTKKLEEILEGKDMVVYLARKDTLSEMNEMTDKVFHSILKVCPETLVVASSSVHATGGAYFPFDKEPYRTIAKRNFEKLDNWPEPLSIFTEPCPTGDYGLEKAYVESWCQRFAAINKNAIAARWGGINEENGKKDEVAYFTVWCHQEDSARFVDSCYKTFIRGELRSGAHYYVISNNTYNVFDIESTKNEIGYNPQHDAEILYG